MAKRRDLKKDIDYLVYEVISDCFVYSGIHPEDNSEEVSKIINDAVGFRNDLIARINNPEDKDNPKIIRTFYKSVEKDLIKGVDKLFNRLSALSKDKK
jgi:hypothetical protein